MLKTNLTHPGLLAALASAGHGSRVLIADGNFPFATRLGPNADLVFLNLTRGIVSATQVLEVLARTVPIEAAAVMAPDAGDDPPIFAEFAARLPEVAVRRLERQAFYEAVAAPETCLVIATGEDRLYGNLLLTIGVVSG